MPKLYNYELMSGGKILGYAGFDKPLGSGNIVIVHYKNSPTSKLKKMKVKIKIRVLVDDGIDCILRTYLDVSDRSFNQIKALKKLGDE